MENYMEQHKFVCPACKARLIKDKKETGGVEQDVYICQKCKEFFPFRDQTPNLIYPKPDLHKLEIMYSGGSHKRRKSLLKRAFDLFIYCGKSTGWLNAVMLVPTYIWSRIYNNLLLKISKLIDSKKVECSCCKWKGMKFGIFWGMTSRFNSFACPQCGSHPRHRFLAKYIPEYFDLTKDKILHFAPETFLEPIFNNYNNAIDRTTTDIALSSVSCLSNINSLPFDDSLFDGIINIHVLEHIEDDAGAMKELHRVLNDKGKAIICVPETNNDETIEFGFEDPSKSHHWRDYGLDTSEKLKDAGFVVNTVTPMSLNLNYLKYGMDKNERFHLCKKH